MANAYWQRARTVWGWDVEASDPDAPWDTPTLIVAKSELGDREVLIGRDCMERAAKLMKKARGTWAAHYGGGYDVPLMLNVWRQRRIVLTGSRILAAEQAPDLKLRDSYPWWLAPLAKVGDAVSLPKLDVDRAQMERLTLNEQADYCERDVDIVIKGVQTCRGFLDEVGAKRAWTAGQSAANIVEKVEPGAWHAMERLRVDCNDAMDMLNSGAVKGGRVEPRYRGVTEGVHVYDMKSAYPAQYVSRDVGAGLRRMDANELRAAEQGRFDRDACFSVLARWRWPWRDRLPPVLDQATLCGAGDCQSWMCDDEVRLLLSHGVTVECVEGWTVREVLPIAQAFARLMYRYKESGGAFAFFSKVFLNAWHGKCSMKPLQEQFTDWLPSEYYAPAGEPEKVPEGLGWWNRYYTLERDADNRLRPFQQPMIAALVLGRCRASLYAGAAAVEAAGYPVLYMDTDSIMTTCPPERFPLPLGSGLGQWAHEGGPFTGRFLGAKAYCLTDANGVVRKCALKGVPHASYRDGVFDEIAGCYREARGVERVVGRGWCTRKGRGRDVRVELFDRALAGGARCMKDGIATFLRGLRAKGDHERRWTRAPVVRTVAPSGRGRVFVDGGCRYLAAVEVVAHGALQRLPEHLTTWREKVPKAAQAYALERELCRVEGDVRRLPRLPTEVVPSRGGPRRHVDAWQAYLMILDLAGVQDHDGAAADRRYRDHQRGSTEPLRPWRGGELDGFAQQLDGARPSSPFHGFREMTRRCRTWLDVERSGVIGALRQFPGMEAVHVPHELCVAQVDVVVVTDKGERWLAQFGPRPLDVEDDR